MAWHARLALDYRVEAGRCVARFEHEGPLRILQSLYPEGDAICHNVLVHPPSGLVGGDRLDISVAAGAGTAAAVAATLAAVVGDDDDDFFRIFPRALEGC